MASEPIDKTKLLAFVHGELSDAEARQLVVRMETDASLRQEIENLSRLHSTIAGHYSADDVESGSEFSLSAVQLEKIREAARREGRGRQWFTGFAWGGALVAASIAAVMFWILHEASQSKLRREQPRLGADESKMAVRAPPLREGFGGGMPRLKKQAIPAERESEPVSADMAIAAAPAPATSPAAFYKMKLVEIHAQGLNQEPAALRFIRQAIDRDQTCVPRSIARALLSHGLRLTVKLAGDGEIQNLNLEPYIADDPAIAECFKKKLGTRPELLQGLDADLQITVKPE